MRRFLVLCALLPFVACAPANQEVQFIPSKKSALELRAAETRLVPGNADTVMRGVIATLHDLGYRITKVDSEAGTVSATRQTLLRMAVVVSRRSSTETIVRANATIMSLRQEAQVDSAEFYEKDFFVVLGTTLARQPVAVPDTVPTPDAARPVGELNTAKDRAAAAKAQAQPSVTTPQPGTIAQ